MLIGYDSESKKITGLITLFQKLKYESKGITSDVVMGFRNLSVESLKTKEDISKLASNYSITNKSAIEFMQGVHDGNIVLQDGQTMLQGYQAYPGEPKDP